MRWLNLALCALMLLFIGVQYNDPDGLMWTFIYAIPMLWTALAAFIPLRLAGKFPKGLLWICIAAAAVSVFYYWPKTPGWWKSEVWWEVETAREGMGMMIVLLVLAVALWTIHRAGLRKSRLAQSGVTQSASAHSEGAA